ncbi:MAG: hypothetical protein ACRDLB_13905 [Actinomycetota bacterium]
MRKLSIILLALFVGSVLTLPALAAAPKMRTLGEDPALDAPPALDLTYLKAGATRKTLEIRIGVANMLPVIGGYPQAPGIEWLFKAGPRTFLAEAYVDNTEGAYLLFEVAKDGVFEEVGALEGTYNPDDGYVSMLVPTSTIGAKRGTKIVGAGENDVDAHIHHAGTTYTDYITTTKGIVVP